MSTTPEIALQAEINHVRMNYHDLGAGRPVILIHGSGPGVSSWANWRTVLPDLSESHRVIAPDMIGFGYTNAPRVAFDLDAWVGQVIDLASHLGLDDFDVVGNSFGGAIALHLMARHPDRVRAGILMGPVGTAFPITPGLDEVWGYRPSFEAMTSLMNVFVHDKSLISTSLVEMRLAASERVEARDRYEALFPEPRQRWVDGLALPDDVLSKIRQPILVLHGQDDQVIPVGASRKLVEILPNASLVEIPSCGHWVQIEDADNFTHRVQEFLESVGA